MERLFHMIVSIQNFTGLNLWIQTYESSSLTGLIPVRVRTVESGSIPWFKNQTSLCLFLWIILGKEQI